MTVKIWNGGRFVAIHSEGAFVPGHGYKIIKLTVDLGGRDVLWIIPHSDVPAGWE